MKRKAEVKLLLPIPTVRPHRRCVNLGSEPLRGSFLFLVVVLINNTVENKILLISKNDQRYYESRKI